MSYSTVQSHEPAGLLRSPSDHKTDSSWEESPQKLHSFSTATSLGSANDLMSISPSIQLT
jgi:hypothetical protein